MRSPSLYANFLTVTQSSWIAITIRHCDNTITQTLYSTFFLRNIPSKSESNSRGYFNIAEPVVSPLHVSTENKSVFFFFEFADHTPRAKLQTGKTDEHSVCSGGMDWSERRRRRWRWRIKRLMRSRRVIGPRRRALLTIGLCYCATKKKTT